MSDAASPVEPLPNTDVPSVVVQPSFTEGHPNFIDSTSVQVRTDVFQGPFDLLLHLILRDEVDLYEVSLFDIVDAYLAEIDRIDACDLELATEFLLIAATLVELKCRRLLPVDDDIDLDDELGLWEERDLLLSRLLECKTFKDAAKVIDQLAALASKTAPRRVGLEDHFLDLTPDLLSGVKPEQLRRAFLKVVSPKPVPEVSLGHVSDVRVSVADAIEELIDELPRAGSVTFRSLTSGLGEKLEVVVRFLAVLELFKQGYVELDQISSFGDLTVTWLGVTDLDGQLAMSGADRYEG
jgi:segregation and condensation protein A